MAEIQLRNVSKRWGSFVGVEKFDLTISDREFLVLLGPSGCGKTTTMRMIAGLEDATEGDIYIDGERVMLESLLAFKRAGADGILTYHALRAAEIMAAATGSGS